MTKSITAVRELNASDPLGWLEEMDRRASDLRASATAALSREPRDSDHYNRLQMLATIRFAMADGIDTAMHAIRNARAS